MAVKMIMCIYFISQEKMPFAVVGASNTYSVGNKMVLGRKTNWGIIEVENEEHCEFAYLRNLIIRLEIFINIVN